MKRTLFRNGHVLSARYGEATALLVNDGRIGWVGTDADAPEARGETVDLDGAWVAPAFVDAHVHATATGLALTGLDLAGTTSLTAALDRLRRQAAVQPSGVILGTGWDETRWPERRPPTAAELQAAAPDRLVYLARVDVHSAVVSPALLPVASAEDGFDESGWLRRDAHHAARRTAYDEVTHDQRRDAQRATRRRAAALGIGAFHELSGPAIAGADDLRALLALARDEPGPRVTGYWGELDGVQAALGLGAVGAAGDLFVDGAIGSRTAALTADYADDPGNRGSRYHDVDAVARHVAACTRAGVQAGFHVIGDDAVATVLDGFRVAAERVGLDAVRAARHRLEHVEMVTDVRALARYGIVASVQPAFDAFWGGAGGMYTDRLGAARAATLNPFAAMADAGVTLAFGSDAPVTPLDPWGAVRAAVRHHERRHAVTAATAFAAHTVGSWRAARVDDAGTLAVGARADLALWDAHGFDLLDVDGPAPTCLRTVVAGTTVYEA